MSAINKARKAYEKRQKERGMRKVCVYVPESKTDELKKTAKELRKIKE